MCARQSVLDTLIDTIVNSAHPEQIILFGSRAKQTAHRESDYDFLLVMRDVQNGRTVSRRVYRALLDARVGVAVDLVVVDAETLRCHRDSPYFIYQQALKEGTMCYERL